MPETITADRAIRDLAGTECKGCGGKKKSRMSHCLRCYFALPVSLRRELYRLVGDGYEEAYARSLTFLRTKAAG